MARTTGTTSATTAATASSRSNKKRKGPGDDENDRTVTKRRRQVQTAAKTNRRGETPSTRLDPSSKTTRKGLRVDAAAATTSIASTKSARKETTARGVKLPATKKGALQSTTVTRTNQGKKQQSQEKKEESDDENERYEKHGRVKLDPNSDRFETLQISDQEKEALIAFCCHNCSCSQTRKNSVQNVHDNAYIQSEAGGLYHRRCCHKQVRAKPSEFWCTAFERAVDEYPKPIDKSKDETADVDLWRRLGRTRPPPDTGEHESSIPVNPTIVNSFDSRQRVDHAAVVLDLSGGVGGGILSLKRRGVAIDTIIRPDVDPVASHVYKWHHDAIYLSERPLAEGEPESKPKVEAGIQNVYITRKADVEGNIDCSSFDWKNIIQAHGTVDIVLAGPLFLNYESHDDDDGDRLLCIHRIADTVATIRQSQDGHPVFVLVEVAAVRHWDYVDLTLSDKNAIQAMLCLPGCLQIDSKYFCPLSRLTTWFTNIAPGPAKPYDSDTARCLFANDTPGNGTGESNLVYCNPREDGFVQFGGFLPNHSMIDSVSNLVFLEPSPGKRHPTKQRPLNCQERETLMGYPAHYLHSPVHDLFTSLVSQGFGITRQDEPYWSTQLPTEYHIFGKCGTKDLKFDSTVFPLGLELPASDEKDIELRFFSEHQYACRLIAAETPMPVWDIVLGRLSTKFPSKEYIHSKN